jgi:hypothetical protein
MKVILFALLAIIPCLALSTTRTVALDGTQQYTSIQTAVNACSNGDSVLVYPGRFIENVNLNSHNIVIASLYARNPLQSYIDSTIVDGNLDTCIKVINGELITVNGFTFVNNEQHVNTYSNYVGGIRLSNSSSLHLSNSIIRDCTAADAAGIGIGINSSLYLSNVKIYNNKADGAGGGLAFVEGNHLVFDDAYPSSIYNNIASKGMDISISFNQPHSQPFLINMNRGSVTLDAPDNYFIHVVNADVGVNIQQAYLNQTASDLFVSPEGNDCNNGLAPQTPLKTIYSAMQRITATADNPRTIFLAPGTYSFSSNDEMLPVGIKSHIRIRGSGCDSTLVDGELIRGYFRSLYCEDILIEGVGMMNLRNFLNSPVELNNCSDVRLSNLSITNSRGAMCSGIRLSSSDNVLLSNIYIGDLTYTGTYQTSALYLDNATSVAADNIVYANNTFTNAEVNYIGIHSSESDLTIRNSIMVNNHGVDSYLFGYTVAYADNSERNLDMSNMLIVNNHIGNSWAISPICIQNAFQPVHINNCTIANNISGTTFTRIFGYADVRNCIFYNHNNTDLSVDNQWENIPGHTIEAGVNVTNCLFSDNSINVDLPNLATLTDNIMNGNPIFRGSMVDSLDINNSMYYYLYSTSPCINTGLADTTGMNLPNTDLNGNPRINEGIIDMGCLEFGYVGNDDSVFPALESDKIRLSVYPNPVSLSQKGGYAFFEINVLETALETPLLEIYNIKGQNVLSKKFVDNYNSLVKKVGLPSNKEQNGEFYSTIWDCRDYQSHKIASGVYLVKVSSGNNRLVKKVMVIK